VSAYFLLSIVGREASGPLQETERSGVNSRACEAFLRIPASDVRRAIPQRWAPRCSVREGLLGFSEPCGGQCIDVYCAGFMTGGHKAANVGSTAQPLMTTRGASRVSCPDRRFKECPFGFKTCPDSPQTDRLPLLPPKAEDYHTSGLDIAPCPGPAESRTFARRHRRLMAQVASRLRDVTYESAVRTR